MAKGLAAAVEINKAAPCDAALRTPTRGPAALEGVAPTQPARSSHQEKHPSVK
jgi:hypothetical protein